MWRNIPCKSLESEQNNCHTIFLTTIYWSLSFYVLYCSLFFMSVQLFVHLTSKTVFCWTFSCGSSDTTLIFPLKNSSLFTYRCHSGWYHPAQMGWAGLQKTHRSELLRQTAQCSLLSWVLWKDTWNAQSIRKETEKKTGSSVWILCTATMATRLNWKKIYQKRNRKRTTKMIIVTEQLSHMGRLTRAY